MRTFGLVSRNPVRLGALVALLPLVSACSLFGPPSAPIPPPGSAGADIAPVTDTIYAFDMPAGVQPVPEATTVASIALPQQRLPLLLADPGEAAARLPAPGKGRAYYFLSPGPGIVVDSRSLQPSFCLNQPTAPTLLHYSVLLLGDGKPQPLVSGRPVANTGEPPLPWC
jgi:hypothetical protein